MASVLQHLHAAAESAGCKLHPLPKVPTLGSTLGGTRAGQMLQVRTSSASCDQRWRGGTEPAISHPGLRGCVQRALGHGARLYVDTSLGQRPREYTSNAAVLSSVGGYYDAKGSRVAMAPDCNWGELVHELTHLAFDKRVREANPTPGGARRTGGRAAPGAAHDFEEPLRTHWRALCARGYSERVAEELVCREHEMHTLRAAPLWTWLTRTGVLWDSALVEATRDLQAVPAAERTRLQGAELRRIVRLRSFVTGPVARVAHLLLPGGVAAWWVTGSVASLAAKLAPAV